LSVYICYKSFVFSKIYIGTELLL